MKTRPQVVPHLAIHEVRLPKGGEWRPAFHGWCASFVSRGVGYCQDQIQTREISAGSTLVFSAEVSALFRASQLNELVVSSFSVDTSKLLGLLSLREQHFLKQAAARGNLGVRVLPAPGAISERFGNLCLPPGAASSSNRLRMLQLFMDCFELEIEQDSNPSAPCVDGRERFRRVMNQMPASEFVEISLSQLAPMMSCSPRHLNRLFREELGASFRQKQIELRLARACELLASSNAKVIEVALESGYQSSSLFSVLFKKHIGVSPGRWRRERLQSRAGPRIHF
jgi:AraC-like DNA-binding protein